MRKIFISALILLGLNTPCFCQSNDQYFITIIDNFAQSLKSNNEALTFSAWEKINEDPQAVEYMNLNFPVVASDFRKTQTIIESVKALKKFRENYELRNEGKQPPPWPLVPNPLSNGDQALRYPNDEQPSNLDIHLQQLNTPPPDNRTVAINMPNQNQTSNQDLIKQRLNRNAPSGQ